MSSFLSYQESLYIVLFCLSVSLNLFILNNCEYNELFYVLISSLLKIPVIMHVFLAVDSLKTDLKICKDLWGSKSKYYH